MAANSIRERLILADKAILDELSFIKTVERRLPSYKDLQNFALTQLPVAAIVGRIPKPTNKVSSRTGQVDQILSELRVDIYVFLQENESADSAISSYLDDLWPQLYADPTRGRLCMFTTLEATENTETWPPFVAFQLTCVHNYQHSTGGI
ncbi:MAG: hypothetical protein PVG39_00195 [Desulfobacteraceae bacterium]|jgi:hypothetical protein